MTTLFDATLALAKALGNLRSSTTTATGSATTIVDSTRTEPADYWNGGTLWITSGTHSGKSRKVTDWDLSTTTFTIPTTTTAAGNGVTYSLIAPDWPQDKLNEFVNSALRDIGSVPDTDVSLTTVANQRRYTLPASIYNVRRVEVAMELSDTPYDFAPSYGWRELDGYIEFDPGKEPTTSGYVIRLTYHAAHAVLSADTDTVSGYVAMERLVWEAAVYAWRWRLQMAGKDKPEYANYMNEAAQRAELAKRKYPTPRVPKAPRLP